MRADDPHRQTQTCGHTLSLLYTPTRTNKHLWRPIYVSLNILFSLLLPPQGFFTADLLAGQAADWTTIEIITLLIIYLPGGGALLRQLIKSVKDL